MRSAVNFGAIALARATGTPTETLLTLRCECGQLECTSTVSISIVDYEATVHTGNLLVREDHAPAGLIDGSEAWTIMDGPAPPLPDRAVRRLGSAESPS